MLVSKLFRLCSKIPIKRTIHTVTAPVYTRNVLQKRFYCKLSTPDVYGGVDFQNICEGDAELEKQLKVMILEVDILRQDGQLIPDEIKASEWRELLTLPSRPSRLRYLTFLFKNQKRSENQKRRIEERRMQREEMKKEYNETGHITYGFGGNTIFLRIYDSTMDAYLNKNLMNAAQFSQHLVIDCSYDTYMTKIESKNCARQMCMLFAENRNHRQPFHLQFCNAHPEAPTIRSLQRYFPPLYRKDYPFFITEKSYLDLYPKEKLVYLTPHCRNDLVEWNHDDIYIIGAMVDKSNPKPLSLAKAKENGLRMAKLPLERHLLWGSGASKNLTLNQMVSILLDMRDTGDWMKAFQHIPRRKIVTRDELTEPELPKYTERRIFRPKNQKEILLDAKILKRVKPRKIDISQLYD